MSACFALGSVACRATENGPASSQQTASPNSAPAAAPASAQAPIDPALLKVTVENYFASEKNYQPGDLLRQSQVAGALAAVRDAGWDVPDREAIVKRALADGSPLIKALATPAGRQFMRRVGKHSGGYQRLDRLSTTGGGEKLVNDLIHQKDGDKLIEYMATTQGGRNMGNMLGGARQGANLNKSTGRIYTADDLVAELNKVLASTAVKKPRP